MKPVSDGSHHTANRQPVLLLVITMLAGLALTMMLLHAARASAAGLAQEEQPPAAEAQPEDQAPLDEAPAPDDPFQLPLPGEEQPVEITDLMVGISVDQDTVRPGGHLVFSIHYTNTTGAEISNIVLTNTLSKWQYYDGQYNATPPIAPENFTILNSNPEQEGYTLVWNLPALPGGASGEIIIATDVFTTVEPNIKDEIILLGSSAEIKTTQAGVSSGFGTDVAMMVGPLLKATKSSEPNKVMPGHFLTYTLLVENVARQDAIAATNVVITDFVPAFTTFVRASSGGHYRSDVLSVVWDGPDSLAPGAQTTVQFTVKVDPTDKTGTSIRNLKNQYSISSDEITLGPVGGFNNVYNSVDALLQKTAEAQRVSGNTALVYARDEVTYTLTVYNPLTTTLSGVLVTDTLPGIPEPFTYLRTAYGSPAPDNISADGRHLTWSVDIPPWGSVSRSFVVRIPEQTFIGDNRTSQNYPNVLAAWHPEASFTTEDKLAPVRVEAVLTMNKIAGPRSAIPGETVNYTVTLTNRGPFVVSNIRLTETLPADFRFVNMAVGPEPLPEYSDNPVVWTGLEVQPDEIVSLSFIVRVNGAWLQNYGNNLNAYSPDAFIPARKNIAPVKINPPLGINKTVAPETTFVNSEVNYTIELTNLSTVTWPLHWVKDNLPTGFYDAATGTNVATMVMEPPYQLPAGQTWSGGFTAYVSNGVACNILPKEIPNPQGAIEVKLTNPADNSVIYAYNASKLAPLLIEPNVQVDLIPERRMVQPGSTVTYTLHMNNISYVDVSGGEVSLSLPPEFVYEQTVSGPAPTNVNGNLLTWTNLQIGAYQQLSIVLRVNVPISTSTGTKNTVFNAYAPDVCFGELGTGDHPLGKGSVVVADDVVILNKRAINDKVAPQSQVIFEIKIQNKDWYPFVLPSVTDLMPEGFTYYQMDLGPEPQVQGRQLVWHNVEVEGGKTLVMRVVMLSSSLYGSYYNNVSAQSPETMIQSAFSGEVKVLPVFDLLKTASSTSAVPGDTLVYTITLVNLSDTNYSSIRITDTLPAGFTFVRTLPGTPLPTSLGVNKGQPVWSALSLNYNCSGGCVKNLVFEVQVGQVAEDWYYNQVTGYSPSGSIPGPINTAPVYVTSSGEPPPPTPTPPPSPTPQPTPAPDQSNRMFLPVLRR